MDRLYVIYTLLKHILHFIVRVLSSFLKNRGILLAGGVGYNVLLSLVPFLTLAVAALSLFFDEKKILGILRPELTLIVPQHTDMILQTVQDFLQKQAATSMVSVAALLLFSSMSFHMIEVAMAEIFHKSRHGTRRSFWVSALLPYLFILILMIALFFLTLLTTGLDALGDQSVRFFGTALPLERTVQLFLRLAGFMGLVLLFSGIYKVLPVVKISPGRALIGGLCAAVLWRLVGKFMVFYFTKISMVNLIYGSLATVIVVLLFLEIAFIILLLGAQVIAELEASSALGLPWHEKPEQTDRETL
jgi:YihY family inner membrane protein